MELLSLLLVTALAAERDDCPIPVTTWSGEVVAALAAYGSLDEPTFLDLAARAEAHVTCLDSLMSPEQAAAWHLLAAVQAWYADPERTEPVVAHLRASLRAGLVTDAWPEVLVPGAPLHGLLVDARAQPAHRASLTAHRSGTWWIDGAEQSGDPALPAIAQLDVRTPTPTSFILDPPWSLPAPPRRGLWVATAVTAGLSVGLWAGATGTSVAYYGQDVGARDVRLAHANHALVPSAAGTSAVALGLGVATLVDQLRARKGLRELTARDDSRVTVGSSR